MLLDADSGGSATNVNGDEGNTDETADIHHNQLQPVEAEVCKTSTEPASVEEEMEHKTDMDNVTSRSILAEASEVGASAEVIQIKCL